MEDDSADQEPHFEVGKEVAEDEDGDGGGDPTGAFEELDGVAWGVVDGLADALPLHGKDDENGKDGCETADTGRRTHPSPRGRKDGEQRIQKADHEPIGLPRFAMESTRATLGNTSPPTRSWQVDKFAYCHGLESVH